MSQLYIDYRASFNEALMYAVLVAMLAALALSILISRSVVAPVLALSHATQSIADGRYDERVQVVGSDELARLAIRFSIKWLKDSIRSNPCGDV